MKLNEYKDILIKWIKEEVLKANAKGVIFGLSGGVDSALVSLLAKEAFPKNHLALLMPAQKIFNQDLIDAREHAKEHEINYEIINLMKIFKTFKKQNPNLSRLPLANTQSRLRMTTLYAYAQQLNYLVLGTDNYAEYYLGYFTKYGDGGVDLLPLVNLQKSEVFEMSRTLSVSKNILNKKPSGSLWENQSDETELGFSYNEFEKYIVFNEDIQEEKINRINFLHKISEHKRKEIPKPPIFK